MNHSTSVCSLSLSSISIAKVFQSVSIPIKTKPPPPSALVVCVWFFFFLLVQPPSTNLVPSQANLQLGIFTPTPFTHPSHPPIKRTNRDRWFAISQSCFRCYRPRVASLCVGEGDFPITSRGKKEGFSVYLIIIKGYQSPHSTVFGSFSRVYSSSFELCSAGWVPLEGVKLIQMQIINGLHTK